MSLYLELDYMPTPENTAVAKGWDFAQYLIRPGLHVPLLEPGWSQNPQIHTAYAWGRCPHSKSEWMPREGDKYPSPHAFVPSTLGILNFAILHPTSPAGISEEWPFISLNDLWHWFPAFVKFSIILLVNSLPTVAVIFFALLCHHFSRYSNTWQ